MVIILSFCLWNFAFAFLSFTQDALMCFIYVHVLCTPLRSHGDTLLRSHVVSHVRLDLVPIWLGKITTSQVSCSSDFRRCCCVAKAMKWNQAQGPGSVLGGLLHLHLLWWFYYLAGWVTVKDTPPNSKCCCTDHSNICSSARKITAKIF